MEAGFVALEDAVITHPRRLWSAGQTHEDEDSLVVEEPLEIRWGNFPLAVVMRTPGHDIELVTGFALTELIVSSVDDLLRVDHCTEGDALAEGDAHNNVVRILPSASAQVDPTQFQRNLFTTSSCGVCGKRSIERALKEAPPLSNPCRFSSGMLAALPNRLRKHQPVFDRTGALHAAALVTADGEIKCVREDIGRHNAVDKVVGAAAQNGRSLESTCLIVSGRASYEIVQKALAARISCVLAVGGVSSLAVDLASRAGITLVGFARKSQLSIYSGAEHIR
jgi:FdhD protein